MTSFALSHLRRSVIAAKEIVQGLRNEGLMGMVGFVALGGGIAILIIRGCIGIGRPYDQWGQDFFRIHKAGQMWLVGENPYLNDAIGFAYPPQASSITAILGLWSFQHAWWINLVANVAALLGMFALYVKWYRPAVAFGENKRLWPLLVGFAYALANSFTTSSFFFGGITLPVYFALVLAWYFLYEKGRPYLAGLFLSLGTLKPQFSLFLCLFLLFEGHWRTLLVGAVIALAMSVPAMVQLGIVGSFEGWFEGMRAYSARGENTVGNPGVITVDSALAALGAPNISLKLLGFAGALVAYGLRQHIDRKHLLIVLPFFAVVFLFSHDNDYVALSLMWLCLFDANARNKKRFLLLVVLALALLIPSGIMQSTGNAFLAHWRVFTITVAFVAYAVWTPFVSATMHGFQRSPGGSSA